MILKVVKYGHPALRKKGARVETITPLIRQLIADMFETMYDARGVWAWRRNRWARLCRSR